MARMTYEEIKEQALALTSYYETSTKAPQCFGVVAGNFDDMGISFGAIQFNFGSGTLQPILTDMINIHTDVTKTAFNFATNPTYYNTLVDVVLNRTQADQVAWGNSISDPNNKHRVIEPWKSYFNALGVTQECIDEQVQATQWYYDLARGWFDDYSMFTRRAYALLFDIAVQNGSISSTVDSQIRADFEKISYVGKTREQIETEKMRIIANRRAEASNSQWVEVVRDRKLSIANGSGWVYNGGLYMDTTKYSMTLEEAFPPENKVRVYIDAGYGGAETGGTLTDGTPVKDVTLDIALKLRNVLMARYTGHDFMMSRTTDIDKSLADRAVEANDWGATYVVSIRVNSSTDTTLRGFESKAVNNFTNPPEAVFFNQGLVHDAIQAEMQWSVDRGKTYLNDALVDNLTMGHIVTLNGFSTNAEDSALLTDDAYRTRIAEAHAEGLQEAFGHLDFGEAWENVDKTKHVFGIDVSSYQNYYDYDENGNLFYYDLDFNKIKAQGVKWIICRAVGSDHGVLVNGRYQVSSTDSTLKMDGAFKQNCIKAQSNGLMVGTYYFANVQDEADTTTLQTATDQANHYADILEETFGLNKWGDLYPMLDFEAYENMANLSVGYIEDWIAKFKQVFEERIPTKLGLYTGHYFLQDKEGFNSKINPSIANMPLWVAHYGYVNDPFNNRLSTVGEWDNWTIWQYGSPKIDRSSWGVATDELDLNYARHLSWLRKPNKVRNLRVDFVGLDVRLTWDFLEDEDIVRYEVKRDDTYLPTVSANSNVIYDTELTENGTYIYTVYAIDELGEMSTSDSLVVEVTPAEIKFAPTSPTNLTADPWYKQVTLAWSASTDTGILGYNIYMDGNWIARVDSTITNYVVIGLENDVTYQFEVDVASADYPNLSIKTAPVLSTPFIPIETPNLPTDIIRNVTKDMDVVIRWENIPKLSFSHFAIKINDEIVFNNLQDKEITLIDLPLNTPFKVNIGVYNIADESVWSEDLNFDIKYPSKPTGLSALPNDKEILLKWNANPETFVKGYNVYLNDNYHAFTTATNYNFQYEDGEPLINGNSYKMTVRAVSTLSDIESETASIERNLVERGYDSFENETVGTSALYSSVNTTRKEIVDTKSFIGKKSLLFEGSASDAWIYFANGETDHHIQLYANQRYIFSMYVYSETGTTVRGRVRTPMYAYFSPFTTIPANEWTRVYHEFTPTADELAFVGASVQDIAKPFYIDAVMLEEAEAKQTSEPRIFVTNVTPSETNLTAIPIRIFPNPPTYVTLEVLRETEIRVTWKNIPKERFSHFAVALNGEIIANDLTSTSYNIISDFPVREDQQVNVISYDTDGDFTWSTNEFFRIEKPSVPTNLKVKSLDRRLDVSWYPNPELFITGYDIYVDGIHTLSTERSNIIVEGLLNDRSYAIQIVAKSDQFESDLTTAVNGTPILDLPNKPRIIDYKVLGTGEVELILDHVQKVDHSHYEVYIDGNTVNPNTSENKSIVTPTLNANQTYVATVQAFDLDGDPSGLSDGFNILFTSETLEYIQANQLKLGEIDETAKPIEPTMYLCKPNKQTIGVINEIRGLSYTVRMGDLNEVSFRIPFQVDRNGELVDNPIIELLRERYVLRLELNESVEHFLINTVNDSTSNEREEREVHAFSLGYELANYQVRSFEKTGYAKDVLEEVLEATPWQLATSLKDVNSYFNSPSAENGSGGRTFDVASATVLDFVKQVASAFGAIILWNTETRSIDFILNEDFGENKGFRISYDKYLRSLSKEVNGDEMVTQLLPIGENGLTIRSINPTQSQYLEDFSYFLYPFERDANGAVINSSYFMTDSLAGAILDFQAKMETQRVNYSEKYVTLNNLEAEKVVIQNDLDSLTLERDIVQGRVDRLKLQEYLEYHEFSYTATPITISKEIGSGEYWTAIVRVSDMTDVTVLYQDVEQTVASNSWTVLGKKSGSDSISVTFQGDSPNAYVELYILELTTDEFEEVDNEQEILDKYILELIEIKVDAKENELNNKQIQIDAVDQEIRNIVFDLALDNNFTDEQLEERKLFLITKEFQNENITNEEELFEEAKKEFEKIKNPQLSISIDILNFLEIVQAQNDWDKLEIGDTVRIVNERLKIDYMAKILEIVFSYEDQSIKLEIASADEIKTDQEKFMDNLYKAVATSTTVDLRKYEWDMVREHDKEIQSWLEDEFDATKKKIIAGTNESIEISRRGLLIKDANDHENFLVAQHKVIAITNDGGKTYKNAITTDGIIAERLVGKVIAGENLIIENIDGSFRIDRDGITVKSFALRIIGGADERNLGIDMSGLRSNFEDWNTQNNENDTTPTSPTVNATGYAIDHIEKTDDTIDISFSWEFDSSNAEGDIDGFMIYVHSSNVSGSYEFGVTPSRELMYWVNPHKRSIVMRNVSKYLYYTFGVQSYRAVDTKIDVTGVLKSPIVTSKINSENPYYPYLMVASDGSIYSTVDPVTAVELNSIALNAIRQGVSYNNVTIDANTGLRVQNSQNTVLSVFNATDGIAIYTKKDPAISQWEKVFYVDTNGKLTAEKLVARGLEILDKNGRKIIDANEGVLNLRSLERIEGQEKLNKVTIGAETIFESGFNPKTIGTLYVAETPVWNTSGVYHTASPYGLHIHVDSDVHLAQVKMYASGTVTGNILIKRRDTGETLKNIPVALANGENDVVLDFLLTSEIGNYWIGNAGTWNGTGVWRSTNTAVTFPYASGDFIIENGGKIDEVNGYYYYFYDFIVSGQGVKGYVANDKTLESIRIKGTTKINGNLLQTGTVLADALNVKGLTVTNDAGETKFSIATNGDTTLRGNIFMQGGSISWGLDPANDVVRGFAWITDTDNVSRLYLNADHIITGTMSFDHARGGTLVLGGENNINGTMFVYGSELDASGNPIEVVTLNGDTGGFEKLSIGELTNIDSTNIVTTVGDSFRPENMVGNYIHFYVNPIGGDDNNAGTKSEPKRTIQSCINALPKVLNKDVFIFVMPTVLVDTMIDIRGFMGDGWINIEIWSVGNVRYIRDWLQGSTANPSNHWVEVRGMYGTDTTRHAGGTTYPERLTFYNGNTWEDITSTVLNPSRASDGTVDTNLYADARLDGVPVVCNVYLGGLYDLDYIDVFHHWSDGRTYHKTKTQVSEDGNTWYTIFDSEVQGEYAETSSGHRMPLKKATLYGKVLVDCSMCNVKIYDFIINNAGNVSSTIDLHHTNFFEMRYCTIFGEPTYDYVVFCNGSNARLISCEVYNAKTSGIISAYGGRIEVNDVKGSGFPYGLYAHSTGMVNGIGTSPYGNTAHYRTYSGGRYEGSWTPTAGTEVAPTAVQKTTQWTANDTQSLYGTNWTLTSYIYQGKRPTETTAWYGVMFFDTASFSALSGKSIKNVRLLLQRTNNTGENNSRYPKIYYNMQTSPSGTMQTLKGGHTSSVGFTWGQSKWITLPNSYGEAFRDGTAKSLVLWVGSSESSYMKFEAKATLEITYL